MRARERGGDDGDIGAVARAEELQPACPRSGVQGVQGGCRWLLLAA
eukprot:CAMPEP_0202388492 /NCGR_PEP_ID=MMETSP1127-20130417/77893_1 /ASSEMBLY_ACC=CAM_ASM_000462 /TAXON_ID=3047 /ORGANISM="Dunaliella tertiolecta, Strain CCMP1320" /LENGTH=45 /DNA_ID= /DNA_START= /DNA_END= /DNA_ORIENTATION=